MENLWKIYLRKISAHYSKIGKRAGPLFRAINTLSSILILILENLAGLVNSSELLAKGTRPPELRGEQSEFEREGSRRKFENQACTTLTVSATRLFQRVISNTKVPRAPRIYRIKPNIFRWPARKRVLLNWLRIDLAKCEKMGWPHEIGIATRVGES